MEVLFEDEHFLAVNKPPGLLMHKSKIARDAKENLQSLLQEKQGEKVFLVHRLDRKTSGVVLVAKTSEIANNLSEQFAKHITQKTYHTIVRGFMEESVTNSRELEDDRGRFQTAETVFKPLKRVNVDLVSGKYSQTRLTFVEALPKTGRMHQIRKHLAQLRHYIVNDKPHGDCKLNKAFETQMNLNHMMLHARQIEFKHPVTNERMTIEAPYFENFERLLSYFTL